MLLACKIINCAQLIRKTVIGVQHTNIDRQRDCFVFYARHKTGGELLITPQLRPITLVVDTNIYVHELVLLQALYYRQCFTTIRKTTLFVPQQVVQELQNITGRHENVKNNSALSLRAQQALTFLSQISNKHQAFTNDDVLATTRDSRSLVRAYFESAEDKQMAKKLFDFVGSDGDSVILQSMLYQHKVRNKFIIFWTNDRKFRRRVRKALINAGRISQVEKFLNNL